KLRDLDGLGRDDTPDFRRASRPFGENGGFTIAESAQFIVLTDDALALELGLSIYGSVGDVFINADGYKKSISNPGIGNYLPWAKPWPKRAAGWVNWLCRTARSYTPTAAARRPTAPPNRIFSANWPKPSAFRPGTLPP